ncbi:class I SAM-dependent methyltransferase [Paraferrimonas haliotis]|uniref:SAM-dependent methyltransferase n=1 Tax=Paraferrimonas haliotis TaxID=2013866 RepID=A0AA37WXN2_9GAMM|nr:class I SAM-dependent methyltransferase [Paraferrimonas haliotis]GLS84557.1 SAM-dependent methyltransferase [Paraferrimonas haliotis]
MFKQLLEINQRPKSFEFYTADELWTNEHTSKQMLEYHLNGAIDVSSKNSAFIDKAVDWMATHFQVQQGTAIADFGCGPGLYTTKLAEKGAVVTGIDFSKRSLSYAKQVAADKGLNIDYIQANYLDFETNEKFDLITMIMYDYCALSPQQRNTMLKKFKSMLKPNGSILFDVYSLNAFAQKSESSAYELNQLNGFWSADDYYCFVNTFKYEQEKVMLDKYTIIESAQTRTVYNWLQYFDERSLRNEIESAGLSIKQHYGDVAGSAYCTEASEFAVVVG